MAGRKPLIAGNWKMFGRRADLAQIQALGERAGAASAELEMLICPPAPYVAMAAWAAKDGPVRIGAQDCSAVAADGARTGDVSAAMLADAGARYIIVGHSERRAIFGDSDAVVRAKAEAVIGAGVVPIICVGETQAERAAGQAADVVARQIRVGVPKTDAPIVLAYEPVWAIGASVTPTLAEIAEVHAVARRALAGVVGETAAATTRILYGGSVNPANAQDIFGVDGVDGALVGRASLKAEDFSAIVLGHPAAS